MKRIVGVPGSAPSSRLNQANWRRPTRPETNPGNRESSPNSFQPGTFIEKPKKSRPGPDVSGNTSRMNTRLSWFPGIIRQGVFLSSNVRLSSR